MASIISLIPWSWRIAGVAALLLGIGLATAGGAWWGYGKGYDTAEAKGNALLAAEKEDRAREDAARALAVATAEREARQELEIAMNQVTELEKQLVLAEINHAKERTAFNRRIEDAAQSSIATCTGLSVEWVRAYNDALYRTGSEALPGYAGSTFFAYSPGIGHPLGTGIPQSQSLTSPADILAHARDLGTQFRRMYRQVNGWIDTHEVRKEQRNEPDL